jgi:hypothetical protein
MNSFQTIGNGLIGVTGSALGIISTFQTELEWWVRISGGLLGIAVACLTLYRLFKPLPK